MKRNAEEIAIRAKLEDKLREQDLQTLTWLISGELEAEEIIEICLGFDSDRQENILEQLD